MAYFETISTVATGDIPVITASLVEDTGNSDNDLITNNPIINGTVDNENNITELKAGFDDTLLANFVDVLDQLQDDNSFSFDATKIQEINNNTVLSQGEHTLKIIATDETGNSSNVFEFTFTLDSEISTPTVTTSLANGTTSIDINFGETIFNATDLNNYNLTIVGGERDGETIEISSTNALGSLGIRLSLNEG